MPTRTSLVLASLLLTMSVGARAQDSAQPSYADVSVPGLAATYSVGTATVRTGEHRVSSQGVEIAPMRVALLPIAMPIATLTVARGEDQRTIRVALETNDHLEVNTLARDQERVAAVVTLALGSLASATTSLTVGSAATCTPQGFGRPDCARPIASGIFGAVGGVLSLVAGLTLLTLPDTLELDVTGSRAVRRVRSRPRAIAIAPSILLGVHAAVVLGVLPYIAFQEPTWGISGPWDALLPGMAAMLVAPALVSLASDLAGGRGAMWAAYLGSLAGWLAMGVTQVVLEQTSTTTSGLPAMALGCTFAVAGAVIGYAVSDSDEEQVEGAGVLPMFAIGPDGASIGLAGSM